MVTKLSKNEVDKIYASVFGNVLLDDNGLVAEENNVVIKLSKEEVDNIYASVFGDKLVNNQPCCVEKPQSPNVLTEDFAQDTVTTPTVMDATPTQSTTDLNQPLEASPVEEGDAPEEKQVFKLTPPENNQALLLDMCAKRGRKLIYRPNEAIITATFKVLGIDKKNDIGEKVKDIIDAEIKQGLKLGYLDKYDGLKSSEIKEEYEDDIIYEYADQEFKKTGVIYDGKKVKVYIYDWDGKACHHVGYVDETECADFLPYFTKKEDYSFDVCGIITGGKAKRVVKEGDTIKIIKEKGEPIGLDVDIAVILRKD